MKKITIHGLPITPRAKIEELAGGSFCVSFATCSARTVDDAIRLVGKDGIVMLDNGAYSHWRKGKGKIDLFKFEDWANDIMARCDQAIAVIPDVIGGTEAENNDLINECWLDDDRCMVVWHMHESIKRLLYLCESFNYVAIGSSGDYAVPGTAAWHAKMREAFAAIDAWEAGCEGCYCRPRIHLMRAQAEHYGYPFDSSDSCTVAMTHWRRRNKGKSVGEIATRINDAIQLTAGAEAAHQVKRPLLAHTERTNDLALYALADWFNANYEIREANDNEPDLFRRAAA